MRPARRDSYDHREFHSTFSARHQPVVYTGLARGWPACRKWSPQYLADDCGPTLVPTEANGPLITLESGVQAVLGDRPDAPYLRNVFVRRHLPRLLRDIRIPRMAQPNALAQLHAKGAIPELWFPWIEFFLSRPNTRFPIVHRDVHHTHAWLAQIYGEKRLWLWPPSAEGPRQFDVTGCGLDQLFEGVKPYQLVLRPGDVCFIPSQWWHTAESLTVSITLSGNFVNRSNHQAFVNSFVFGGAHLKPFTTTGR